MSTKKGLSRNGYVAGTMLESDSSPTASTAIFPRSSGPQSSPVNENMYCLIGKNQEKPDYRCYPYRSSTVLHILMVFVYICTAGFMWLMFYWRPDWKLKFSHYKSSFEKCTSVYLEALDGTDRVFVSEIKYADESMKKWAPFLFSKSLSSSGLHSEMLVTILSQRNFLCQLHKHSFFRGKLDSFKNRNFIAETNDGAENGSSDSGDMNEVKYFHHHLAKFVWDEEMQTFIEIDGFDGNVTLRDIHSMANKPVSKEDEQEMIKLYGENVIHVEIPSYFELLIAEVLNPFYVFQLFACLFWMADEYYAYATAIIIISFISAVVSLISIRRERENLHDMVERHNTARITVIRDIREQEDHCAPSSSNQAWTAKEYITEEIWIKDLVPGDIVAIPPAGVQLSFDAALMSGTCIVNESMLTGESVPVTKTALPSGDSELDHTFKVDHQKAHTLFCGTEIMQTRYYQDEVVKAVVVRTGFCTAKGQLVHSILFPKPVNLKLLRDSYRFVGVMCAIALVGFAYSAYTLIQHGESARDIVFKSIDIITITVPPALPLAMTIGIIYAQDRLKKAYIRTISPQRINICGQVDVVAFDKTGTLTEDGLDLANVIPVSSNKFAAPLEPNDMKYMDKNSELLRCMATCHSLTVIEGNTTGDPLDMKMFEATGFELVEPKVDETTKYDQLQTTYVRPSSLISDDDIKLSPGNDSKMPIQDTEEDLETSYEVGIIRQFPFLSSLQRASVITKPLHSGPSDMVVYVKGAPETIARLCLSDSIPVDFTNVLKIYTKEGYRVIALAFKKINLKWLKAQKIERDVVESDLEFLGFLILQNKLKPTSAGVIKDLDEALIRCVMVTGDNLETAISVGRECKILKRGKAVLGVECDVSDEYPTLKWQRIEVGNRNTRKSLSSSDEHSMPEVVISMGDNSVPQDCHIAVTGKDFAAIREHFPQFLKPLIVQGAIFARMSPSQKTELMEELEAVDYHTLMCGDGANDCGALKRAHVGLSLSELEASVAAPFTAKIDNGIQSVVTLMREGRTALVTSFGMFKFMALYSMIQFTTILLLYQNNTILSDYQFLYIDLIIIDFIAITMSRNYAYKTLHRKKPPSSLVCPEMIISLLLQIALQMGLQIFAFLVVQEQCWYRHPTLVNETGAIIHSDDAMEANHTNGSHCPALENADQVYTTEEDTPRTYETTTLTYVSSFMYMSVSVAFSQGRPFRTAIYKNKWFLGSLLVLVGFTLFMMFGAPPGFNDFMELWRIPDLEFLFQLCAIIAGHLLISLLIERFFIENPGLWYKIKSLFSCKKRAHRKQYKTIECALRGETMTKNSRHQGYGVQTYFDEAIYDFSIPSRFEGQIVYSKTPSKENELTNQLGIRL